MPTFDETVATLAARPDLRGKRVADIPQLAVVRLQWRRQFYRWANWHFALAVFNLVCATSSLVWLWPINAAAAGLSVTMMLWAERRARALTRQLNRSAAEQIARDLFELRD